MTETFTRRDLDSPRLSAEILLSHVLGCDRLRLYMETDRPASPGERDRLRDLVRRALSHEPIQYLTGEAWFFGMAFKADRRALIPRPSTETILEHVLQRERAAERPPRIADVCTGSGCIAVALAKHLPRARMTATDISPEALALARENTERHGVADRIEFVEGDLLAPLAGHGPFDWIVSNPPYIPDHEWDAVEPNVKNHEPHLALRAGRDGLQYVRPLIESAPPLLADAGEILIEIAACTAGDVRSLAAKAGWSKISVLKDHEAYDRVLTARR